MIDNTPNNPNPRPAASTTDELSASATANTPMLTPR